MSDLRTAAQQALEALDCPGKAKTTDEQAAITALKAALEQPEQKAECDGGTCGLGGYCDECPKRQPEQEPVAWMSPASESMIGKTDENGSAYHIITTSKKTANNSVPLFTHPPRREWRGLTEEEKRECAQAMDAEPLAEGWSELVKFARAIEQALKEKNHE